MAGNLVNALTSLLQTALPALLGGDPAPVKLSVLPEGYKVDPASGDAPDGDPQMDDRQEHFAFDPGHPAGPYTLTQAPYPGPRRVWLATAAGDHLALHDDEVAWDPVNPAVFHLNPRPSRDLAGFNGVDVLYGVTAIYTKLKAVQTLSVLLIGDDTSKLDQAEALALAVVMLNRERLLADAGGLYHDGDYGAQVDVKSLKLLEGTRPDARSRGFSLLADLEIKVNRALQEGEGKPIVRIRTPGQPATGRPVDIQIDVGA